MLCFSFIQFYVIFISFKISSLTYGLFRVVLFNFLMFGELPLSFCYWFLVCFHHNQRTNSTWFQLFLNLLRSVLWQRIRCILVKVSRTFEKNIYCAVGWDVLHMSNKPSWLILLYSFSISLLTFCVVVLSLAESCLEVPNYNCVFFYFSLKLCSLSFMFFGALLLSVRWSDPFVTIYFPS